MPESDDDLRDFHDLMARVSTGSEEAAWELVTRYEDCVRRAVRRALSRRLRSLFDSADFTQRVWFSFFRHGADATRFDRPEQLVAFLIETAKRDVAEEVRGRLVRPTHNINRESSSEASLKQAGAIPDGQPAAIDTLIQRERLERFQQLLSVLPLEARRIVQLRLDGLNDQQAANWLGIALNTVRRFWRRLLG